LSERQNAASENKAEAVGPRATKCRSVIDPEKALRDGIDPELLFDLSYACVKGGFVFLDVPAGQLPARFISRFDHQDATVAVQEHAGGGNALGR
jgi:hypothetical protein